MSWQCRRFDPVGECRWVRIPCIPGSATMDPLVLVVVELQFVQEGATVLRVLSNSALSNFKLSVGWRLAFSKAERFERFRSPGCPFASQWRRGRRPTEVPCPSGFVEGRRLHPHNGLLPSTTPSFWSKLRRGPQGGVSFGPISSRLQRIH
jgi:hypothetical protein